MASQRLHNMGETAKASEMYERAEFAKVEAELFAKLTKAGVSSMSTTALIKIPSVGIEGLFGFLGASNPFVKDARDDRNEVWILDNTGYKTSDTSEWQAEVVACFFQEGNGDIAQAVAAIADTVGIDGEVGPHEEKRKLIAERLRPFVDAIAPARTLPIVIKPGEGTLISRKLGPSNISGVSIDFIEVGSNNQADGTVNKIESNPKVQGLSKASGVSRLAAADGWCVISDIDDTIKITQVRKYWFHVLFLY